MRKYRKREHVENYLRANYRGNTLLEDVFLPHNSLPEMDFDEVDTSVMYLGKKVHFPLMINAMTGGTDFTEDINRDLAEIAKKLQLPMAVGSETVALEEEDARESFEIVRKIVGEEGMVLSNLSGRLSKEDAEKAMEIVKADAIQVHLNPAQELAMEEGDREFKGILENISALTKGIQKPVVVKEVGFGMSADTVEKLYQAGVRHVDISGFGGTNFFEVENLRCPSVDMTDLYGWGIPTAYSLIEAKKLGYEDLHITASGGVSNALDLVKCLVLGADMVGISGELLNYLMHGGLEYATQYLEDLIHKTKVIMLLLGAKNVEELSKVNWKATGKLKELLD